MNINPLSKKFNISLRGVSEKEISPDLPVIEDKEFFEKKLIKAGESIVYRFEINPLRDLGFINKNGDRYLDKGEYRIMVGDQKVSVFVE